MIGDFACLCGFLFPSDVLPAPPLKAWCVPMHRRTSAPFASSLLQNMAPQFDLPLPLSLVRTQKIADMRHEWRLIQHALWARWPQHGFLRPLKNSASCRYLAPQPRDVIVRAFGRTVATSVQSRQRWLFYAYDRIRRTAAWRTSFGERTLAATEHLLSLLSAFEVVGIDDGWPRWGQSRLPKHRYRKALHPRIEFDRTI